MQENYKGESIPRAQAYAPVSCCKPIKGYKSGLPPHHSKGITISWAIANSCARRPNLMDYDPTTLVINK